MATKVELETETADLKKEIAELKAKKSSTQTEGPAAESAERAAPMEDSSEGAPEEELRKLVEDLTGVIEDHPTAKTLLLLLGVFGAGYLLGRSR